MDLTRCCTCLLYAPKVLITSRASESTAVFITPLLNITHAKPLYVDFCNGIFRMPLMNLMSGAETSY